MPLNLPMFRLFQCQALLGQPVRAISPDAGGRSGGIESDRGALNPPASPSLRVKEGQGEGE